MASLSLLRSIPQRVSFHAMMEKYVKTFHSVYEYKVQNLCFIIANTILLMPKIYVIHWEDNTMFPMLFWESLWLVDISIDIYFILFYIFFFV